MVARGGRGRRWGREGEGLLEHLVVVLAFRRTLIFSTLLKYDQSLEKALPERVVSATPTRLAAKSAMYSSYKSAGPMKLIVYLYCWPTGSWSAEISIHVFNQA
jgi:hypothetical protein